MGLIYVEIILWALIKCFFGNDFWEWHILQNRKSPNSLRFESRSYNNEKIQFNINIK